MYLWVETYQVIPNATPSTFGKDTQPNVVSKPSHSKHSCFIIPGSDPDVYSLIPHLNSFFSHRTTSRDLILFGTGTSEGSSGPTPTPLRGSPNTVGSRDVLGHPRSQWRETLDLRRDYDTCKTTVLIKMLRL